MGRGGKETRISFNLSEVANVVNATSSLETQPAGSADSASARIAPVGAESIGASAAQVSLSPATPAVSLSASPNVHVNVEIHIAADATADTVREIFRNMARYVLDKPVHDDVD